MKTFIGIDVSEQRGCAIAQIDELGRSRGALWSRSEPDDVLRSVKALSSGGEELVFGIDSPRQPVNAPREWYWDKKAANWRRRLASERGWGRHCEVVIAALKIANPQWTPPESEAPAWMRLGFQVFAALQPLGDVHEVFPTSAYAQLANTELLRIELSLAAFAEGPKDMLDAYVAALTVSEFSKGFGASVGGGDGLGSIVLPRPIDSRAAPHLLEWPVSRHAV